MADQSYDNLTHSQLVKQASKEDKNVSFQIDVWGGNTSLVIFEASGGKPWKHPFSEKARNGVIVLLEKMLANPEAQRQVVHFQFYDQEAKKVKQVGAMGIGLDEKHNLFFDFTHNELRNRYQFVFRSGDIKFDLTQTSMTERDHLKATLQWMIDILRFKCMFAERMSSFKRPPQGGGGGRGNYGGGGGNRGGGGGNYGNNNSGGGGGGGNRQSGTFGGGGDEDFMI